MDRIRFRSHCPICHGGGSKYWSHYSCGGDLYLCNNGILECENCDARDYIFNWRFNCDQCHVAGEFKKGSYQGFLFALSQFDKAGVPRIFIMTLLNLLTKFQSELVQNYKEY